MYLGLGLRLGSSTVTGFDADAAAYFDRAGVTDATAKGQINAFVKGVKDLGLYNSMVCWPLRSAQNKGSGTTAYSLGGLGTFDGTLVGVTLPTWGTDGVAFDGIDNAITTTFNPAFNNVCVFAAANTTNRLARRTIYAQKIDGPGQGFALFNEGFVTPGDITAEVYDGTFRSSTAGTATDGQFAGVGTFWDKSNVTAFRDATVGAASATSSATTLTARFGLNHSGNRAFLGKIAGIIVVHNQGNVFATLRSLYKTTLGTGLGLP